MSIRVLVADDHAVVRLGVIKIIELEAGDQITVVGEVEDGDHLLAAMESLAPDVVVMDVMMPGIEVVSRVRQAVTLPSPPRVLILTAFAEEALLQPLLAAGISGYLIKDEIPRSIVQAIRAVAEGQTWFSQRIAGQLMRASLAMAEVEQAVGAALLTPRELEILQLIGQGRRNSEIADHLALSKPTVQNYVSSVYAKLGVESRAQAILYALRNRVVNVQEVLADTSAEVE